MPKKTITKNAVVVIFLAVLSGSTISCYQFGVSGGTPPKFDSESSKFGPPKIAGRIQSDEINESSGLAVSKCQEDLLWTHNDSGDGPYIFALDEHGKHRGTWKVESAENKDWEDIAAYKDPAGNCFLVIGDTGNSRKEPRTEHKIYRVAEPTVVGESAASSRKQPLVTAPADVMTYSYPDEPQDAETLLVEPKSGDIFVLTKQRNKPSGVYHLKQSFNGSAVQAERITEITVPAIPNGFLTGGDISPDGRHVIVCDYFAAYEFVLPEETVNFDEIWKQKPAVIDLGDREQGEAIAYSADGTTLYATSEKKNEPLITVQRSSP